MNSIALDYRSAHNKNIRLIGAGASAWVPSDIAFAVIFHILATSRASDRLLSDIREYIRETAALPEPQKYTGAQIKYTWPGMSYRRVSSTLIYVPTAAENERARLNALPLPCGCSRYPIISLFCAPIISCWRWLADCVRESARSLREIGIVIEEDEHDHSADDRLAAETRR